MKAFRYGIEVFDGSQTKYGGHWQALSRITCLDYLSIDIRLGFAWWSTYYDGYHNRIGFGLFSVNWGGSPLKKDKRYEA